jgi:DNA-directed RNA polymerase subunit H (RpoH/RPB5)
MANQNTSSLISQIYKSRGVVLELMKKQDYDVSEYDGFSINEINTMKTNNQLDMILSKKTSETKSTENYEEKGEEINSSKENNQKKIYIKYYLGKSLRPNNLQEMIDDLFNVEEVLTKEDTLLIVVKDEVNETLTNSLMHIWESEKIFIIIMPLQRLQFNILEHVLVPPHRILNESEKINVKTRYNIIHDEQFPQLSRFDPVAKAIGIRPGEVCEITRPSKTAISAPYYRICF